jgi:hypothetical protein
MSGAIRSALSYLRRSAGGNIWSTAFARSKVPDARRGGNLQMQLTLGDAMQATTVPLPDWARGFAVESSAALWWAVNETPVPAGLTVTEIPRCLDTSEHPFYTATETRRQRGHEAGPRAPQATTGRPSSFVPHIAPERPAQRSLARLRGIVAFVL